MMDHSHARSSLLSAGAVASPHLGTANHRALLGCSRGQGVPTARIVTDTGSTAESATCTKWVLSRPEFQRQIIYKSWKIQIINPKASDKTAEYKKFLHTAKLFKSKGLIA